MMQVQNVSPQSQKSRNRAAIVPHFRRISAAKKPQKSRNFALFLP